MQDDTTKKWNHAENCDALAFTLSFVWFGFCFTQNSQASAIWPIIQIHSNIFLVLALRISQLSLTRLRSVRTLPGWCDLSCELNSKSTFFSHRPGQPSRSILVHKKYASSRKSRQCTAQSTSLCSMKSDHCHKKSSWTTSCIESLGTFNLPHHLILVEI